MVGHKGEKGANFYISSDSVVWPTFILNWNIEPPMGNLINILRSRKLRYYEGRNMDNFLVTTYAYRVVNYDRKVLYKIEHKSHIFHPLLQTVTLKYKSTLTEEGLRLVILSFRRLWNLHSLQLLPTRGCQAIDICDSVFNFTNWPNIFFSEEQTFWYEVSFGGGGLMAIA